jgi:hypothetical protein
MSSTRGGGRLPSAAIMHADPAKASVHTIFLVAGVLSHDGEGNLDRRAYSWAYF